MTISSIANLPYANSSTTPSSSSTGASPSANNTGSVGDQLLAALAQSDPASVVSPDALLQDFVSLSPAAYGQPTDPATQTYNAQGLLQQVQSAMTLNDPLLQSDSTDTNPFGDSLLQSLMSMSPASAAATNGVAITNPAVAPGAMANGESVAANTQTQASATSAGATDLNANWAQVLKQNPSLAPILVESEIEQSTISALG